MDAKTASIGRARDVTPRRLGVNRRSAFDDNFFSAILSPILFSPGG
jgi:hypothetical protein